MPSTLSKRPPMLPWSAKKWSDLWCQMQRMATKPIPRTKFLLLKVPVSNTLYEERMPKNKGPFYAFNVPMYCARMTSKNISVGLVIDCTALDSHLLDPELVSSKIKPYNGRVRYWHDTKEWDDFDIDYVRLLEEYDEKEQDVEQGNVIPSQQVISKFISICVNHLAKARGNSHIAIFDSRGGLGAASFLVAHYMCTKLRAPVHTSIASIKNVLEPGIYDENILRRLQETFRGRREIIVPKPPKWVTTAEEEDDDDDEHEEDGKESSNNKKKKAQIIIPPYESDAKIPPFTSTSSSSSSTSNNNNLMLPPPPKRMKLNSSATNNGTSLLTHLEPGSQKYTRASVVFSQLTNNKLSSLFHKPANGATDNNDNNNNKSFKEIFSDTIIAKKENYRAVAYPCVKKDDGNIQIHEGFLLFLNDGTFFIDGNNSTSNSNNNTKPKIQIFHQQIKLNLPRPTKLHEIQHRTCLYGHLIIEQKQNANTTYYSFAVFDLIALEGGIVHHKPLEKRFAYLKGGVMDPKLKVVKEKMNSSTSSSSSSMQEGKVSLMFMEYSQLNQIGQVTNYEKSIIPTTSWNTNDRQKTKSCFENGIMFANISRTNGEDRYIWSSDSTMTKEELFAGCIS